MADKPIRSVVKAFSWRITATLITTVASLVVTGKLELALSIGAVDFVVKLLTYFFHERLWEKIPFGRKKMKEPEYHI